MDDRHKTPPRVMAFDVESDCMPVFKVVDEVLELIPDEPAWLDLRNALSRHQRAHLIHIPEVAKSGVRSIMQTLNNACANSAATTQQPQLSNATSGCP